jgi:hypothetical protein
MAIRLMNAISYTPIPKYIVPVRRSWDVIHQFLKIILNFRILFCYLCQLCLM